MNKHRKYPPPEKLWRYAQIQPDEVFSSWVARTAWANQLAFTKFVMVMWAEQHSLIFKKIARPSFFSIYPDYVELEQFAKRMAETTSLPIESVCQMKLWPGSVSNLNHFIPVGEMDRIFSRGSSASQRKRTAGSFCPECLAGGYYLRRPWRLALAPCCLVHQRVLLDGCPRCHKSHEFYWDFPYYRPERNRSNLPCRGCAFDLVNAGPHPPGNPLDESAVGLQMYFLEHFGWAEPGHYYGPRSEHDMILRLISLIAKHAFAGDERVLLQSSSRHSASERFFFNHQNSDVRYDLLKTAGRLVRRLRSQPPAARLGLRFYKDRLKAMEVAVLENFMTDTFPTFLKER